MNVGMLGALLVVFASNAAHAADYRIQFGEMRQGTLVPTRSLKMCVGQTGYHWGFEMDLPPGGEHNVTVGLTTPAPPAVFAQKGNATRSTQFTYNYGDHSGHFSKPWAFDNGDPLGAYSLNLFVDGALVSTIDFTVVAAKGCP